jgi:hypothetical protein
MSAHAKSSINASYDDGIDICSNQRTSTTSGSSNSSAEASTKHLNFYESMYHFKKMFPRIETDVIESVLRTNNGKIDKTIDDLLNLNPESELNSSNTFTRNFSSSNISESSFTSALPACLFEDSPPSYFELMKKDSFVSMRENFKAIETQSSSLHTKNETAQDMNSSKESHSTQNSNDRLSSLNSSNNQTPFKSNHESQSITTKQTFLTRTINNRQILIGNLSKDFLRIKLNSQQIKSFKSSIKKARRSEITAILNEKQPEYPDLSFQMKKKLNILENRENKNENNTKTLNKTFEDASRLGFSAQKSELISHVDGK